MTFFILNVLYVRSKYDKSMSTDADGNKVLTCNDDGPSCRRSLCECDKQFSIEYGQMIANGEYNEAHHQENGFDPHNQDSCARAEVDRSGEKECCGVFPFRYP